MAFNAGNAFITISPDMSSFQRDIKAQMATLGDESGQAFASAFQDQLRTSFANLPDATVKAVADTAQMSADLDAASANRTAAVTPEEDKAALTAVNSDFDRLARDRTVPFRATVDDKAATVELDTLTRDRTVKVKVREDTSQLSKLGGGGSGGAGGLLGAGPLAIGGGVALGASLLPALVPTGVGALFGGLGAVAADQFNKKFATGLSQTQSVFQSTVSTAVQPLANMLSSMLPDLDRFITSMGPQLQQAFSASAPFMAEFLTIGEEAVQTLLPAFTQLMNTFAPELPQLGAAFQTITQGVATFLQALGPGMQAAVTIFTGLATAVGGILGFLGNLASGLALEFADAGHLIGQAFTAIEGAAKATASAVKSGWNIVVNFFKSIPGTISGIFSGASSLLVGAGKSIMSGLGSAARAGWGLVSNWFHQLPGAIKGIFDGAAGWLLSAGEAIVRGLIDGIRSIGGEIGSTLMSFVPAPVRSVVSGALGFIGFASGTPSAPAGWAWVGEQGPELVRFSGGEQVLTHGNSMGALSSLAASAAAPARLPGVSSPLRTGTLQLQVSYAGSGNQLIDALVSGLQFHIQRTTGGDAQAALGQGPVRV